MPMFRERVWGRESLAPYFPVIPLGERIGEVWFTAEENLTSSGRSLGDLLRHHPEILGSAAEPRYPGICPLLVKLLFTESRLSVQVHPDDEYAQRHHRSLGKTEAWYVLEVEPQGEIALGFRNSLSQEKLREAVKSGEIESMLRWYPVRAGDVFYVPAGTVHAIGAGVTLCEIQENSDITYRLFDFGRGRDLHLDHAVEVSRLGPYEHHARPVPLAGWRDELLACPYFRIERLKPQSSIRFERGLPHYLILMSVKGSGTIAERDFKAGQAWLVPAGSDEIHVHGPDSEWVLAYSAKEAITGLHT
jgi:mannose-6-phosphate isomerase